MTPCCIQLYQVRGLSGWRGSILALVQMPVHALRAATEQAQLLASSMSILTHGCKPHRCRLMLGISQVMGQLHCRLHTMKPVMGITQRAEGRGLHAADAALDQAEDGGVAVPQLPEHPRGPALGGGTVPPGLLSQHRLGGVHHVQRPQHGAHRGGHACTGLRLCSLRFGGGSLGFCTRGVALCNCAAVQSGGFDRGFVLLVQCVPV